ncbi:hypothetical protein [Metasolibacillus sp. FSL K6-0083]|uniref:hypothetical protein n=1 Tax=Metasolibacillus sp. FSL K6-0083 TaxID=2921416 RepID=UPI003159ABFC
MGNTKKTRKAMKLITKITLTLIFTVIMFIDLANWLKAVLFITFFSILIIDETYDTVLLKKLLSENKK